MKKILLYILTCLLYSAFASVSGQIYRPQDYMALGGTPVSSNQIYNPSTGEFLTPPRQIITFNDLVIQNFIDMYNKGVPEKLYLHTDKTFYSAGETIWFKGYLVNAVTLNPNPISEYIYVELIDENNTVQKRIKVQKDNHGFHNALELEPELAPGRYVLRAYTRWMENEPPDYFFQKLLYIGNTIDDEVVSEITYTLDDDEIVATIYLKYANHRPMAGAELTYYLTQEDKIEKNKVRTDDHGNLIVRFPVPPSYITDNTLRIEIDNDTDFYKRTFHLPVFQDDFDLQFFPEGGHLLPLGLQVVAFKAIGTDGFGTEVTGTLHNSAGDQLFSFESIHRGMGRFSLNPIPGEQYYALVTSGDQTKRFELPPVESSGSLLNVVMIRNRLVCQITATADFQPGELGFVIHSKGKILAGEEIKMSDPNKIINTDNLPPGIAHLSVVHIPTNEPLAERLVFIRDQNTVSATMELARNQNLKTRRHKIKLDLKTLDRLNQPVRGNFSVSITDVDLVQYDPFEDHIHSNLLLTSDLKGYIEDPGYYFMDESDERNYKLDLLMLTQGWRRFDLFTALKRTKERYRVKAENAQHVSGQIKNPIGGKSKRSQVVAMDISSNKAFKLKTGKDGDFDLVGLNITDTSSFIFQPLNHKGRSSGLTLEFDEETFPEPNIRFPRHHYQSVLPSVSDAYLENAKQVYYDEGGIRVIHIRPVSVSAPSLAREQEQNFQGIRVDRIVSKRDLAFFSGQRLTMVIATRFNLREYTERNQDSPKCGQTWFLNIREKPVLFASIDGILHDIYSNGHDYLNSIRVDDIDVLGFIPDHSPANVNFGLRNSDAGGVIMIKLKTGEELNMARKNFTDTGGKIHQPMGYKAPAKFYEPKYDVAAERNAPKPDLRTTIYWNPEIKTNIRGYSSVSFFTADRESDYRIILEGISEDGQLCRYEQVIQRE